MGPCSRKICLLIFACWANAAISESGAIAGRKLFLDPQKGNCAACHQAPSDPVIASRSKVGPALSEIKKQYPDRARLRAVIWALNDTLPDTIMPPYGKHRILTDAEIDTVVDYLEGL